MSKIIFTVPPVQPRYIWGELSKGGSIFPPLGISILASITRNYGFKTKIMDFLAEGETIDNAVMRIIDERPKYIGITSTTESFYSAVQLARAIKKINNETIILLGGPHISSVPTETMERFGCFDIGFIGESEETIVDFLRTYEDNGTIAGVKGLVIRKDNRIIYTGIQPPIMDMDRIPFPAWDLLPDARRYYKPAITNYKRKPVASLVTSRGCVGKCIFCDSAVFGNKMRSYSSDYVIMMIEHLIREYKIKEICFYDDSFLAFRKRLLDICNYIIDKKIDITWSCESRVNLVVPELLKIMKRAGCWQISYGIESGSQKILDILKKEINIQQVRDAVRYTKRAGISTRGYFMIGNPGERKEDIFKTYRLMLDLDLDDILITYFTPYLGTPVYKNIRNYGTFNAKWRDLNTFSVSFVPEGLSENYLKRRFKSFYMGFYFRPRIIFNYIIRLGNLKSILSLSLKFIEFVFLTR